MGERNFECANKLIQEAGYKGEKVLIIGKRSMSRALVIDIAPRTVPQASG